MDIEQLAIEAGINLADMTYAELGKVVRLVAERCAGICEDADTFDYDDPGASYAVAIRREFGIT